MTRPFDYDNARELQVRADEPAESHSSDRIASARTTDRDVAEVVVGGTATTERLKEAGIASVKDLVTRCAAPADRVAVATATGLAEARLAEWASSAELLRITGITPEFAAMLKAVGVGSIADLRGRQADRLADALLALTSERSMTLLVPSAAVVDGWIRQAERLTPVVVETKSPYSSPRGDERRSIG